MKILNHARNITLIFLENQTPTLLRKLPSSIVERQSIIATSMTTLQTTIKKYAEERDKRLAAVRTEEYASFRDHHGLHGLAADPFIDYDKLEKGKPLKDGDEIKFLAIGAGISCLLFAHRLVKAGFQADDFVAVDTAGGFGGTWLVYKVEALFMLAYLTVAN